MIIDIENVIIDIENENIDIENVIIDIENENIDINSQFIYVKLILFITKSIDIQNVRMTMKMRLLR